MSATDQPSEEELRAAYEAEIKKIRIEQILLEQVVTMINLGMRRTGLQPGTEDERDIGQVRTAIEAVRALLPLVEQSGVGGDQSAPIREALSQLQLAFVRLGGSGDAPATGEPSGAAGSGAAGSEGAGGAGGAGGSGPGPSPGGSRGSAQPEQPKPGEPGPAQRSGRLWVPGQ